MGAYELFGNAGPVRGSIAHNIFHAMNWLLWV